MADLDKRRFPWRLCAALLAVAAMLRLWRLGFQALSFDEYNTWRVAASASLAEFLRQMTASEANPPLHFLLVREWMALFGDSPASLRFPSALFGTATVWAAMRMIYDARPASRFAVATVGVLAPLSPYSLFYSQQARPYALLLFLVTLLVWFVVRIWRTEEGSARRRDLAGLAVTATLAALTHFFALFPIGFAVAALAARQWRARRSPRPAEVVTAALLGALCVSIFVAGTVLGSRSQFVAWLPRWSPADLYYQWIAIAEGPVLRAGSDWMWCLTLACWAGALALGFARAGERLAAPAEPDATPPARPAPDGLLWLLLLLVATTVLLPHAVCIVKRILFHGQRYMIVSLPAFWFATALAASAVAARRRWLFAGLLLASMLCQPLYLREFYLTRYREAWDKLADACHQMLAPGDAVWYIAPWGNGPLAYYLRGSGLAVTTVASPEAFPAPTAEARRIAIAATKPQVFDLPPPAGFVRDTGIAVERGQARGTVYLAVYRRQGEPPAQKP